MTCCMGLAFPWALGDLTKIHEGHVQGWHDGGTQVSAECGSPKTTGLIREVYELLSSSTASLVSSWPPGL
jgi:hypothetical protein